MIVTTSQSIDGYEIIEYQDILMEKYAYQITLLKAIPVWDLYMTHFT